jgi:glycosyltransferase involved in cell wall biosynthesis
VTSAPGSSTNAAAAVIPVFNEAKTIADIVRRAAAQVDRVIVVDDGSTDGSLDALAGLGVEIVRHPENRGKGAALLSGIERARARGAAYAITLDADGQHPPECIPDMLARTDPRTIVLGSRMADAGAMPIARLRANRTANFFISWAAGHWIDDTQCGFRVYPLSVFAAIRFRPHRRSGFVLESEVLIDACRAGYRVVPAAVPALYGPVLQRPSHFRPVFDIAAIVIMVTGKLAAWGFYPLGLIRSQRQRRARRRAEETCIRKRDAAV